MGRPPGRCPPTRTSSSASLSTARARPRWHRRAPARRCACPRLPGFVPGADRGYTQALPERFPFRAALGYSVGDGLQGPTSAPGQQPRRADGRRHLLLPGHARALGVGQCRPAPRLSTTATFSARIAARPRGAWCAKRDPTTTATSASPALPAGHIHTCAARCSRRRSGPGPIPVLLAPADPPKICTQSAVTIAPDVGARYRQDLAFGSPKWHGPTPPTATPSRV